MIYIFFTFIFLLSMFISFSFMFVFIQSLFSFFWFLGFCSFLVSFYKYGGGLKEDFYIVSKKSFLVSVMGLIKFLFFYFMMESYFNFVFLLSYFLGEVFFDMMLLFKQGMFPFIIYNFLIFSFNLSVYFLKLSFLIFLLFSKFWCFILFSKLMFCLEFYFSYVLLGLLFIFKGFKKWVSFLFNKGIVLNNLLLFIFWEVFKWEVMMLYNLVLIYYYKDLFLLIKIGLSSKFSSLFLVFNFMHGGFFNPFLFMKVICLLGFFYYGGFIIVFCFLFVSFIYFYYSLMGLVSLVKVMISMEVKVILNFLIILLVFLILSVLYEICNYSINLI